MTPMGEVTNIDRARVVIDESEAERQIQLSNRLAAIEAHLVEIDRQLREIRRQAQDESHGSVTALRRPSTRG